jgi:putative transposase
MTSPTPLEYGQYYHIYNRGNNGENLFFEERNYPYFLKLYAHHILPVANTYAYCLLRNHFHALVRIRTEEEQQTLGLDSGESWEVEHGTPPE